MIRAEKFEDLSRFDELINLRIYHDDLKKYSESVITFRPSYKIKPRSSPIEYEFSKGRLPSYCDRILYKANIDLHCLNYKVCEYTVSDHLPVVADFDVFIENSEILNEEDYRFSVYKDNIQAIQLHRRHSEASADEDSEILDVPEEDYALDLAKAASLPVYGVMGELDNDDIDEIEVRNGLA